MTALAGAAAAGLQIAPICGQPPRPAHLPSRRRGGPRSRLTREKVLRAALDFVDANGLAALSMHKLGAELGVQGMSLYSHVESKDALLDGIVEAMSWEAQPPPAEDTGWRDALRRLAAEIRAVIRRHPAAAPLLASRPVMPTRLLEQLDACAKLLMRAGFTENRAMDVLRTVYVYAHGYALGEACYTACDGPPRRPRPPAPAGHAVLRTLQHGRPVQPRHRPDDPRPGPRGRQARPLKSP
jgi:AcrR family transcriptional regulator